MKLQLALAFIVIGFPTFSQKTDSTNCFCSYNYTIKYPKEAEANKISGTVIIEFDRDSTCALSNPKVIKAVGYGCDDEALRIAGKLIENEKKCLAKCASRKCDTGKIKQTFTFLYTEEK